MNSWPCMGRQNAVLPAPAPPPVEENACPRRCEQPGGSRLPSVPVNLQLKGVWRKAGGLGAHLRGQGAFWLARENE